MHNQAVVSVSLLIDSSVTVQGMSLDVTAAAAGSGYMSLEVEQDNLAAVVNMLHHRVNNIAYSVTNTISVLTTYFFFTYISVQQTMSQPKCSTCALYTIPQKDTSCVFILSILF